MQVCRRKLAARDAPLAQDLKGLFWRKGKGFINKDKRNFFIRFSSIVGKLADY
jgi:hypothetical protein